MATEYFNDAWRIPNNKNQSLVSNYSMDFDGSNDYIDLGLIPLFNTAFTKASISLWAKTTTWTNSNFTLLNNRPSPQDGTGFALNTYSTNLYLYGSGFASAVNIPFSSSGFVDGTWNHILITIDTTEPVSSDRLKFYINGGDAIEKVGGAGPYAPGTTNLLIGDGLRGNFNGSIDQVCFFDYTLSAGQVSTLYGGGTAVTNPLSLSPKPKYYAQLGDQSVDNGANYLVPNNSLQDYVFNFDGSDIINLNLAIQLSTNKSISAWVYVQGGVNQKALLGANFPYYYFWLDNANSKVYIRDNSGGPTQLSTGTLSDGWTHFCITGDSTTATLYVNGVSTDTGTDKDLNISKIAASPPHFFNDKASNIAIWNVTLTASNVSTIYNNGSPADISSLNPVSWWKLNAQDTFDGTNWTIKDYAGSNDGTSSGMTSANLIQSNLQHTSGFSPYALSLDGVNDYFPLGSGSSLNFTGDLSISFWIKTTDTRNVSLAGKWGGVGFRNWIISRYNGVMAFTVSSTGTTAGNGSITGNTIVNDGNWHHVLVVNDSTTTNNYIYIDGYQDATANVGRSIVGTATPTFIGVASTSVGLRYLGDMSNFAFWNTVVTPEQVNEIYNQGVPTNLNTFSGTTPLHWWQLGSNSSFNAGAWTCLDETGTLNAVSNPAMTEDDITNGVGYSGNGLGTSSIEIIGSAPYSTANGISNSMDVLSRSTDLPPTV
jgi:hypothetical protein